MQKNHTDLQKPFKLLHKNWRNQLIFTLLFLAALDSIK